MIFDKTLKCLWEEKQYPKGKNNSDFNYTYKEIA